MTTRGSRQYWPHRRAARLLPRARSFRKRGGEPRLGNLVAYKAGMSNIVMMDDSESPSKQQEVSRACTVLEVPTTEVYGIRFYKEDGLTGYRAVAAELYSKSTAQKLKINAKTNEGKLQDFKSKLSEYSDVTALLVAYPKTTNVEQNKPERFESHVDGKSIEEKFDFVSANLGKEVRPDAVFKQGEYVDVSSVTKGKGWQGIIKRYGAARLPHKSTQKVRHIGTHGDMGTAKVMYTVPQPGQTGYNYRTERNKRILKLGAKDAVQQINPSSGFKHYGTARNSFMVIEGSIPGPARRLVRIRESLGNLNAKGVKEPKIVKLAG